MRPGTTRSARAYLVLSLVVASCDGGSEDSFGDEDTDVLGKYAGSFADNDETLKHGAILEYSEDATLSVRLSESGGGEVVDVCLRGTVKFILFGEIESDCDTQDAVLTDGALTLTYKAIKFTGDFPDELTLVIRSGMLGQMSLRRDAPTMLDAD